MEHPRTITRRQHHRGMFVTVTWRDGTTTTGYLLGWGAQLIRLNEHHPNPNKTRLVEKSTTQVERVVSAR